MPGPFGKNCATAPEGVVAPAPNPDPSRWTLIREYQAHAAYVVELVYHDCTNFEGRKIMVFRGKFVLTWSDGAVDPHFHDSDLSPLARFIPTEQGWNWACAFAGCVE